MTELVAVARNDLAPVERGPLDRNPAAVYLAGLSEGSRRTMLQALNMIASTLRPGSDALTLPWSELRYQHVAALRSKLAASYAPATGSKMLCALRGALREAWRLGQIPEQDYRRAIDIQGVRGQTLPAGRALSQGEITALLHVCAADPTPAGTRDGALIAILYGTGIRRAEAVGLDLEDFDPETGELRVLRGKGAKDRIVYVANGASKWLTDWLGIRGPDAGPLFLPVAKGGRVERRRLTTQAIYTALQKRARQAGVGVVSPHDLRRTNITQLLEAGADLLVVSRLAGHASVQTTSRYDRRGEAAKRTAAGMLHVPYRGQQHG